MKIGKKALQNAIDNLANIQQDFGAKFHLSF